MIVEYGHLLRMKIPLQLKIIIKAHELKSFHLSYGLKFNIPLKIIKMGDRRHCFPAISAGEIPQRISLLYNNRVLSLRFWNEAFSECISSELCCYG